MTYEAREIGRIHDPAAAVRKAAESEAFRPSRKESKA
jgi:hypothetical protein